MNKQKFIYPMLFSTIPVRKMWGGNFISDYLKNYNKETLDTNNGEDKFGELWLVTDRKDEMSVVENGDLKGVTLNTLWNEYNKEIFGKENLKSKKSVFPLLIKIIDAAEDLSLQVHPSEENLKKLPNAEAKTEMWFVIDCENNANILAGIKKDFTDSNGFFNLVNNSESLKNVINNFKSVPYHYFYIPSGTIHAIGKGNLVFEIQQNSDTTYRVSDWGRKDSKGKSRELHIEESKICIDFTKKEVFMGNVNLDNNITEQQVSPNNPYFNLHVWNIRNKSIVSTFDTYKILTVISGDLKISFNNKDYHLTKFSTVLLPIGNEYTLIPLSSQTVFLSYYA